MLEKDLLLLEWSMFESEMSYAMSKLDLLYVRDTSSQAYLKDYLSIASSFYLTQLIVENRL